MADPGFPATGYGTLLAAATSELDAARALAEAAAGVLYADVRASWAHLPFRGLLLVAGQQHRKRLAGVGDVGVYRVQRRVLKPGRAEVYGLFPMCRAPGLSHGQADAHWRDVHGPLALLHHGHMSEYVQLNVMETLVGEPFDGFALCGFATEDDLRNRFYSTADGPAVIARDVQRFADVKRSPRRLVAAAERFCD